MEGLKPIKIIAVLIAVRCFSLLVCQGGAASHIHNSEIQMNVLSDVTDSPRTEITVENMNFTSNITLDDVFISVKTTQKYQFTRLPVILKTWFQLAKQQTWFFTDITNRKHQQETNYHMVNTGCPANHAMRSLCCKTNAEYDFFIKTHKKWFCHFDDDNYVNVPRLVEVLQRFNYKEDWYLGRNSLSFPVPFYRRGKQLNNYSFWFGTGGAGICISRNLALKMLPIVFGGRFVGICEIIQQPDDVALGFVIEIIIRKSLTVMPEFHSHLEPMGNLDPKTFKNLVSFGFSRQRYQWNVVNVSGFDTWKDPTRFLSLHCFLFPYFPFCPKKKLGH